MTKINYRILARWVSRYPAIPVVWALFVIHKIGSLAHKTAPVPSTNPVRKILIIKLVGLGDTVLMLRPVRALRRKYPDAYIETLVPPSSAGLFYHEPAVDCTRVYDLFGRQKGLRHFVELLLELRKQNFDMVLDFEQHIPMTAVLSWFTGASDRIGLAGPGNSRSLLLTDVVHMDGSRHMAEYCHELAVRAGAQDVAGENRALYTGGDAWGKIRQRLFKAGITEKDIVIGVHPGSGIRVKARRWFPDRFAMLIDEIQHSTGAKIILTGRKEELEVLDRIAGLCKFTPVIHREGFSVEELACLIGFFDVYISNDTGPMHMGPAMGTPTIGLFGPESPKRYRPLGPNHRVVYKGAPCSPCIRIHLGKSPECKMDVPQCMDAIAVDEVLSHVQDLLRKFPKIWRFPPVIQNPFQKQGIAARGLGGDGFKKIHMGSR